MRNKLLCTFAILTLVATGAFALENLPAATGTLTSQADMTLVVETAEGPMTFLTNDTTEWIDKVNSGDTVLVRYDPEDNHAIEVFEVHEKIKVTDQLEGQRRAVLGKVTGSTPNELLVESNQGTIFVLRPDELYPPLPTTNDKVAVVYRVQELQGDERAIGTDLAVLPEDFELPRAGSVQISSEPIEQPETETVVAETTVMVETTPEPAPEPKTETTSETQMASLPQTASPLPLIGLLGALSLSGGIALRRRNRK